MRREQGGQGDWVQGGKGPGGGGVGRRQVGLTSQVALRCKGRNPGYFFLREAVRTPPQRLEGLVPAGGLELCIHCELLSELPARLRNEQPQDGHRAHACSPGVRASLGGQRDARTDTGWMDPRELPSKMVGWAPFTPAAMGPLDMALIPTSRPSSQGSCFLCPPDPSSSFLDLFWSQLKCHLFKETILVPAHLKQAPSPVKVPSSSPSRP